MDSVTTEANYPLQFRKEDAKKLGEHLRLRHCVNLVGMKRVGISNFLRFFLFHKEVIPTYIDKTQKHLLIPVDLNDLVERELYPFWTLTFKRIVDSSEASDLPDALKQKIASTFLASIQSQDLFLLIDGVRRSLTLLVEEGYLPTLFLLRFDRIKDVVTPEFFSNLEGLRDSLYSKLSLVFTSYRTLDELSPEVFTKASLSAFSEVMYLLPSQRGDLQIIFETYKKRYSLPIDEELTEHLFALVGGYVQFLQIALILLHEKAAQLPTKDELTALLLQDERILLQSEELWESLLPQEKLILIKLCKEEKIAQEDLKAAEYLLKAGVIIRDGTLFHLFSPLFTHYVSQQIESDQKGKGVVFSKKEHLLFSFLHDHLGEISEREQIIEAVWPEYVEFGVSDWSIDRLVARVRSKLKDQASPYEIKTVRTRGYVLISKV